jgi:hypothetical protein
MHNSDIAQLQKRVQGWERYVKEEVSDVSLKRLFTSSINQLRALIGQYFSEKSANGAQAVLFRMKDVIRSIEQLHEEARLRVGP